MVIKTVQKKGGLKTVQNDTENNSIQTNDVCLKTKGRLFSEVCRVASEKLKAIDNHKG